MKTNKIHTILSKSVCRLAGLSRAIFSCYMTHNYMDNYFNHEKTLHSERSRYLYEINQARCWVDKTTGAPQHFFLRIIDLLEQAYEVLQAISLLIYRVEDHSTFAVADKEFLAISGSVVNEFDRLAEQLRRKKSSIARTNILNENIYEFEEINRSALQVVAREPLVFMIFIQDMHELDRVLMQLSAEILDGM
jgi:hypothetical protein